MNTILRLSMLAGVIALLFSCGEPNVPAITESPSENYRNGHIVWRDLVTLDAKASADFYSNLFGWEIRKAEGSNPDYYQIRNRGELIGGIIDYPSKGMVDGNEWLSVWSSSSLSEAAASIPKNGGQMLTDPQMVEGRGEFAVGVDPSGGIIGLLKSSSGDPEAREPGENDWLWTELWSTDPGSVTKFYTDFGYAIEETEDDGNPYWVVRLNEKAVAGIMQNPIEGSRSFWIPYIRVSDPLNMAERVKRFGGKVLVEPSPDVREGGLALCTDPLGAPFAMQTWSK